jgi:succinoglycan biosynthesis protein ExoU
LIDVVVATWNSAATIERALSSALAEPETNTVVVVDDCSTDDTANRARRFAATHGERVVVHTLPNNVGPSAARNIGIELSTAPWIAILDGDDFFQPGRLTKLLEHAVDNDFVADNVMQIDESRSGQQSMLVDGMKAPRRLDLQAFVLGNVSQRGKLRKELGFLKPIMRRSFLDGQSLRYDESLRLGEDYALYAHALALGARFLLIPACGYASILRSDSLSHRHSLADLEHLRDSDLRLREVRALSGSERRAIARHYRNVDAKAQWINVIDAVKARSATKFVAPFFRSWTVSRFLLENLAEQAWLRGRRQLAQRAAKR